VFSKGIRKQAGTKIIGNSVFIYIRDRMKNLTLLYLAVMVTITASAQHMNVKQYNFTSFVKSEKSVTKVLEDSSSATAKQHPEYGYKPHNAQCKECAELIDRRTIFGRYYINPAKPNRNFTQQSYFPLHYKKHGEEILRTINPLLAPSNMPGVYEAPNQPVPTRLDVKNHTSSVTDRGFEFVHNKDLKLYFYDGFSVVAEASTPNYTKQTVGSQGTRVTDIWPGINMEQIFNVGEIKTNYVIPSPLSLPISTGLDGN
jgi:hypothetical protein